MAHPRPPSALTATALAKYVLPTASAPLQAKASPKLCVLSRYRSDSLQSLPRRSVLPKPRGVVVRQLLHWSVLPCRRIAAVTLPHLYGDDNDGDDFD